MHLLEQGSLLELIHNFEEELLDNNFVNLIFCFR